MKKRLAALLAVATLFLFAGCSFSFYQRQAESKDIYKDYLAMETDASDSYTERVAERSGAAVVTVIANSVVRTNRGSESTTQIFSGIIINAEGYVLTTSHAAVLEVTSGGSLYTGRVLTAYAVLPEIYGDKSRYKLTLVDYNTDAGLALLLFFASMIVFITIRIRAAVRVRRGFRFLHNFRVKMRKRASAASGSAIPWAMRSMKASVFPSV